MTISMAEKTEIRLNETDPLAAAKQNVRMILATMQGSVPLYREFGVDMTALDKPLPVAKNLLIPAIREAVERWEPRATVINITFGVDDSQPRRLMPTVEVEFSI